MERAQRGETKRAVLRHVAEVQVADAVDVADALGMTAAGASTMLRRYHKGGVLLRRRVEGGRGYEYELSERGEDWLAWAESG